MSIRGTLTCPNDGTTGSSSTTTTLTLPAGCVAGDRVFYAAVINGTGNTATLPSGHTVLAGPDSPQSSNISYLGTGVLTSGDITTGSLTITWSISGRAQASGVVVYGLDATTPYETIPAASTGITAPGSTPTSATTRASSHVLEFGTFRAAAPLQAVPTWPAGFTVAVSKTAATSGNNPSAAVAYKTQVTAGSVGGDAVTATNATNYVLYTVATRAPDTTPPAVPTSLTAVAGNASVVLDWADNSEPDLANYRVYQGATVISSPTASTLTVTSLTNGTAYTFGVAAVDTSGNASTQATATATPSAPVDTTPPAAPTGLIAAAGDSSVVLDWADNSEPDFASYRVYQGATLIASPTSSTLSVTGLTNGTAYTFSVAAVDTTGNASTQATVTTTPVATVVVPVVPVGSLPAPSDTTYPYAGDTKSLLPQIRQHVVAARVKSPLGTTLLTLDLTDLRLSFDDRSAPRVKADIEARVPDVQDVLDQIDPRSGCRIEIDLGYIRPGGARDVSEVVDLLMTDREVSRPANTMSLTASSDERVLLDTAPTFGVTFTSQPVTTIMRTLINSAFPTARSITTTLRFPTGEPLVAITDPISDKATTLYDLADQIGARVFDDGTRAWWITQLDPLTAGTAVDLSTGSNGTIESSSTGLSRGDGFYNRVALDYRWQDAAGANKRVTAVADATGPAFGAVVGNYVTYYEQRETPTTQAQANAAAASIVSRTFTRGRSFTVEALAAYWVRPGQSVTLQLPLGDQERHLVQAVEFRPMTGLMSVTTRLPDSTAIITTGA